MKSLLICLTLLFSSCGPTFKMIGEVNMISNRNIDMKTEYVLISSYAGGTDREIKRSQATTIDEALNNTVGKTPGGEFIMNVKIYYVEGGHYAVVGDVYGKPGTANYHGFKVGDKVVLRKNNLNNSKKGNIISLKDMNTCVVELDNGKYVDALYTDLLKIEN
jgi:hypothetical protein